MGLSKAHSHAEIQSSLAPGPNLVPLPRLHWLLGIGRSGASAGLEL